MEKCWFVLLQTDFPPPTFPATDDEQAFGRLCLGHIVPSLKQLDHVLNPSPSGPDPYPADMPIWEAKNRTFKWTHDSGENYSASGKVGGPTVPGVGAKGDAGLVFKNIVANFTAFESLDTYIADPPDSYIDDSLVAPGVVKHLEKQRGLLGPHGSWALYMISGVAIARGAKDGKREDTNEVGVNAGAGITATGVGDLSFSTNANNRSRVKAEFGTASDYVFAVRLAKISKGVFGASYEVATLNKGATYSLGKDEEGEGKIKIEDVLREEGLDPETEIDLIRDEDDIFVIQK